MKESFSLNWGNNNILTSITYPSGRVITYTPDQIGRISQVSTTLNGNPKTLATGIAYLPFGGITGLTYGNGLALSQGYDNQYRISPIVVGSILNLSFGYDPNGNITSITNPDPPGGQVLESPGVYTYQEGTNKLTHISGTPPIDFGYDANANITTENTWTYVYDLSNQLIRVLDGTNQIAEYTYNGAGQRIKKVTQAETRIFHYDLRGHLIAETNQTGQMLAEYIFLGDQLLSMIKPGESVYYYHNDHLGSPQVLTDDSQAIAWKAVYTPFGGAVASIQTVENPFRFPGQYYDPETGLHYNYFRYYDPTTGRYVTPDPIGLEAGINLFVYVAGNPINYRDPSGLAIFFWHGIITLYAARAEGVGLSESFQMAWQSMWRDWHTQGPSSTYTNIHGMIGLDPLTGRLQTPEQAKRGAEDIIAKECGRPGNALHTVQDLQFSWHSGQAWPSNNPFKNPLAIPHWALDVTPPVWELWNAFQASRQYLRQQGR